VDLLSDDEIEAKLGELEGWERSGDAITKTFERGDFVGSVRFVDASSRPRRWVITPTSRSPGTR
jgi:pterin-4a-carbinolamine dehydratase